MTLPDATVEAFVADPVADPETDCILCGHVAHPSDVCGETLTPDLACPCWDGTTPPANESDDDA